MSHSNGHTLQRWEKGDRLTADTLNANFQALYDLAARALSDARTPDGAVVGLEMAQARLAERVAGLEDLTAMHAHQRNEKQYVALSDFAAIIVMVNDLRRDVEHAIDRAVQIQTAIGGDLDDLKNRLLRIEQQPDAAEKEAFTVLAADHKRIAVEHDRALAEIVELRHEVKILTDWTQGTDQRVNRVQYAPLALVGAILQRLDKLEAANG